MKLPTRALTKTTSDGNLLQIATASVIKTFGPEDNQSLPLKQTTGCQKHETFIQNEYSSRKNSKRPPNVRSAFTDNAIPQELTSSVSHSRQAADTKSQQKPSGFHSQLLEQDVNEREQHQPITFTSQSGQQFILQSHSRHSSTDLSQLTEQRMTLYSPSGEPIIFQTVPRHPENTQVQQTEPSYVQTVPNQQKQPFSGNSRAANFQPVQEMSSIPQAGKQTLQSVPGWSQNPQKHRAKPHYVQPRIDESNQFYAGNTQEFKFQSDLSDYYNYSPEPLDYQSLPKHLYHLQMHPKGPTSPHKMPCRSNNSYTGYSRAMNYQSAIHTPESRNFQAMPRYSHDHQMQSPEQNHAHPMVSHHNMPYGRNTQVFDEGTHLEASPTHPPEPIIVVMEEPGKPISFRSQTGQPLNFCFQTQEGQPINFTPQFNQPEAVQPQFHGAIPSQTQPGTQVKIHCNQAHRQQRMTPEVLVGVPASKPRQSDASVGTQWMIKVTQVGSHFESGKSIKCTKHLHGKWFIKEVTPQPLATTPF